MESELVARDRLVLKAKDDEEADLLEVIHVLNEKGGMVPLVSTFCDLINKGVMKQWNGRWIWDKEWEILEEPDIAYQ